MLASPWRASTGVAPVSNQELTPVQQIVAYRTLDEGSVVLENAGPARQLRRQVLQTVLWYDPDQKANIEIGQVSVTDGGSKGDFTTPTSPFADAGLFVP